MKQRICRRCQMEDMQQETSERIRLYVKQLPQDEKVSEEEYRKRLLLCQECNRLLNGICVECGCFIEMRAAMLVRHCPLPWKKW